MTRPAVALAVSFVDCINRADIDGLIELMSEDHSLEVFDEEPMVGANANRDAWIDYFMSFPDYVIYPRRIAEIDGGAAVLGHTTGSHLGLSDDDEKTLTLIWVAHVEDGAVTRWRLVEDSIQNRRAFGFND